MFIIHYVSTGATKIASSIKEIQSEAPDVYLADTRHSGLRTPESGDRSPD